MTDCPYTPRPVTTLRQRMIEDMAARNLNRHTQRSHISSCKRFAAYLKRSPDTATADEVRLFQLHLIESGASIGNRLLSDLLRRSGVDPIGGERYRCETSWQNTTMTLPGWHPRRN